MKWGGYGEVDDVRGSTWSIEVDIGGELWGIICFGMGDASVVS
jgi:hypothetical protein